MGKTSVCQELGRRLEAKGWVFLFADIEGAACAEDVIAELAETIHPVASIASRFANTMKRWINDNIEEVSALDFRVKIRAGLNAGSWQRHGEELIRNCAEYEKPILLVIDELPIFLKRLRRDDGDSRRVDEFLSWLRSVFQGSQDMSPVLIVSGSIGLNPLMRQLGLTDRTNYLDPFRLGPWGRDTSIRCFHLLAKKCGLVVEDGVASAVYDALGVGIPHHVQSFFARLREHAQMQNRAVLKLEDVGRVYRTALLGPAGQNDLTHYETRLREGLDDDSYRIAMEILAEAATQGVFTSDSRRFLESLYSTVVSQVSARIADVLEVLVHDGYLEDDGGHRFTSLLLRDWWSTRFRDHHVPLNARNSNENC